MPNPVVHFQIASTDPASLARFYSQAFGWQVQVMPDVEYTLIDTGAGGINGGIARMPQGQPSFVTIYIEVDEPAPLMEKIEGSGGRVLVPVTDVPRLGVVALFADPEGHAIGLVQAVPDFGHHEYRVYEWPKPTTEGAVVHFEIMGRNPQELQQFYRNVFGWHVDALSDPDYAPVDTHTIGISGSIGRLDRAEGPVTFYIQVVDLYAALDRVTAAGGHTVESHPPTFALFADPEGNVIGLVQEDDGARS